MSNYISEPRAQVSNNDTRNRLWIFGSPIEHSVAPKLFDYLFPAIGLPNFEYGKLDCTSLTEDGNAWSRETSQPYALGSCITMPLKGMYAVDELDDSALAIGSVNTTFFRFSSNPPVHVGMNLDQAGVGNSLLNSLTGHSTPFPAGTPTLFAPKSAAALMVGGGGATRAAVYAMHEKIGVETILLLNRDPQETAAIVAQFEKWDLRPVESVEHAEQLLKDLAAEGKTLCIGTGAIPAIDPVTDGEKLVYAAAKVLFNGKYEKQTGGDVEGHLKHPEKPVFLDMVYKPRMTPLRQIAEAGGWDTICGVEVVLEGCFEQTYVWTGIVPSFEVREGARKILRAE